MTEFLKYASGQGWVDVALIEQLWTTKALRYRAVGQEWGEDEQFRVVQSRNLKLKSPMVVVNTLS
ncbi:tyrosine-type recombinase/integrase, partial [Mycobacterium kansasii]